jgi:lipoprotein-releasing system permease protein
VKSYAPFLSLRYLWFHKVSSGLGILGVTLGVALVVIVVGVMDGFQKRLKASLIGNTAALVVEPRFTVDVDALCRELKARIPGVRDASPVVYAMSLVGPDGAGNRESLPCRVAGIDAERENAVSDLGAKLHWGGKRITESGAPASGRWIESASEEKPFQVSEEEAARNRRVRAAKQGVVLGYGLADRLRVREGSRVRLMTGKRKQDGSNDATYESEVFTVTAVFTAGDAEIDSMLLLMDRRDALSFFKDWLPQDADEVRLLLDDPEACVAAKDAIKAAAPAIVQASLRKDREAYIGDPAMVPLTWRDKHRRLLAAVENERGLLIVITSFSFLVVAFLIGSTQSMLVVEKTREIGVLRSLGASVPGTASVFLGNGLFIGTVGASAGAALGVSITSNIQGIADLELFPRDIYRFDEIPIDVKGDFLLSICVGAVVFALLGALLPAVRAAMLDPVESLHHE